MVAVNRLTGHSPGFFSVYTLPPNQATSVDAQVRINARRKQVPPRRDVRALILAKTRSLLTDCDAATRATLLRSANRAALLTRPAHSTPQLKANSVSLVVTSPPFLDVVNYAGDNWLRGWFCGIDTSAVEISMHRKVADWQAAMTSVFARARARAAARRPRGVRGGRSARRQGEARRGGAALRRRLRARAAARRHQRAAVHQDGELLGRPQQLEGHEHEPDCGIQETRYGELRFSTCSSCSSPRPRNRTSRTPSAAS